METDALPPYKRPYKLSPKEEAEVKRQVSELQARGLIEPSSSPYGAPVLFVEKKDGSLRMSSGKVRVQQDAAGVLGYIVGSKGIAVDPAKVQVVKEWPMPRNLKDLQAFLGLANYFRRFIPNFSSLAAPLTNLTSSK
ncbi:hypothetical protein QJQ45_021635 [Haematococcus lacustris]|nr:hypothetical protein QJQ45_021635 [Haematococcus lacustris]